MFLSLKTPLSLLNLLLPFLFLSLNTRVLTQLVVQNVQLLFEKGERGRQGGRGGK